MKTKQESFKYLSNWFTNDFASLLIRNLFWSNLIPAKYRDCAQWTKYTQGFIETNTASFYVTTGAHKREWVTAKWCSNGEDTTADGMAGQQQPLHASFIQSALMPQHHLHLMPLCRHCLPPLHTALQGTGNTSTLLSLLVLPSRLSLTTGNIWSLGFKLVPERKAQMETLSCGKSVGEEDTMNSKLQQRGTICT